MKKKIRIGSGFSGTRRGFLIKVAQAEHLNWKRQEKRAILNQAVEKARLIHGTNKPKPPRL